jgi:uncharacterized caspase-like protein
MSEDGSLTDAVKQAAGISLTEAMKGVGGHRTFIVEEALGGGDAGIRPRPARWTRRAYGACLRLAALAVLAFALLAAGAAEIDAERPVRATAAAQRRVALVVGNSAYRFTARLANPRNDAADMGAALRRLGFHVIEGLDLGKAEFDRKLRDFAAALHGADLGVFFYAGHGLQVAGRNYLVPVDSRLESASALDFEMVRLDMVHATMQREAATSILFFDACRDNPLARSLARTMGTRSAEVASGLAAVSGGVGSLISFSTQPGNVAADGKGRNSPYSGALVRRLGTTQDDLNDVLMAVRSDVMRETSARQVPWEHSALTRRVYLHAQAEAAEPASLSPPAAHIRLSEAAEAWNAARDTRSIAVLEAFLARYGATFYAELARARIEELRK